VSHHAGCTWWTPGALAPVAIDLEAECGVSHDRNVWMIHDLVCG
jgi:hypothetical protein